MDAGGPAARLVADWAAVALSALGAVVVLLLRLRRGPGDAPVPTGERVLLAWTLAATLVLVFVVSWSAEGEAGAAHRAPRYLVMLFPAPWILGALGADALFRRLPWRWARHALALVVLAPGVLSLALPEPLRGARELGRSERDPVPILLRELERARTERQRTPWLLADFPVGDARHWRTMRFPLSRSAFLRAAGALPAGWAGDPRLLLLGRFPQMVYQRQPELYRVDAVFGAERVPALFAMEHQPLPPLRPLLPAGEVGAESWPLVVALSADRAADRVFFRPPQPTDDGEPDRIRRFQTLQPDQRALGSLTSSAGPLVAIFRVDLPTRRWPGIDLHFGTEAETFAAPDLLWAWRWTLYVPWLGYGWSHGMIDGPDIGAGPPLPRGLRFPLATTLRVATSNGAKDGVLVVLVRPGEWGGNFRVEGNPLPRVAPGTASPPLTVEEIEVPFSVSVADGTLDVEIGPSEPGSTPWSLVALRFHEAGGASP
jgi:hypothetical protein